MNRRSALLILPVFFAALLASTVSRAQDASFVFEPPEPVSTQSVKVRATFFSSCYTGHGGAEVVGEAIRITAFEGCTCLPALPFPVEVATTVGPLDAGGYEVDLVTTPDPRDPECSFEPADVASAELTVDEDALVVEVDPPAPTTADDVTVKVLSGCPAAFDLTSRSGSLIRVTEVPSRVLAPCSTEPAWSSELFLGKLPAGDYALTFFFDDGQEPPRLTHSSSFQVAAAPAPELLLHQGRFRITVEWERRTGAGAAQALTLGPDSGVFSFPRPSHLELLVKVLDVCRREGHFRVLAAGATHAGLELTVEDTRTGATRTYSNPLGRAFQPVFDTRSFPCD